jgi:hypothetical protein
LLARYPRINAELQQEVREIVDTTNHIIVAHAIALKPGS